jgi:hypothetical protein
VVGGVVAVTVGGNLVGYCVVVVIRGDEVVVKC